MNGYSRSLSGELIGLVFFIFLLGLGLAVFVFFAVIGLVIYTLLKLVGRKTVELVSFELAPTRLFNAPRETRWISAYNYWLYQLWRMTGTEFHTSPGRLMAGALIISCGAGIVIGVMWSVLVPGTGIQWLLVSEGVGVGIGALTGLKMAQPAPGWFRTESDQATIHLMEELDGFMLGEEIEGEW